MSVQSPMKSFHFAAVFAVNARPRQVRLSPRVFQALSRPRQPVCANQRRFTAATGRYAVPQEVEAETSSTITDTRAQTVTPSVESSQVQEPVIERAPDNEAEAREARRREHKVLSQQQLLQEFKSLMRTLPHPVAIITSRRLGTKNVRELMVGATVSSFNTVSLEPEPIVSFNLTKASATYQAIVDSKHFSITFPTNTQLGSDIAHTFTRGNAQSPFDKASNPRMELVNWGKVLEEDKTGDSTYYPSAVRLGGKLDPVNAGFAFGLLCEYQTSVPVGDHVIVTGRVLPLRIQKGKQTGWGHDLTYGNTFASSHVTLAYLHGSYTNTERNGGTDESWKRDDEYLTVDLRTADETIRHDATTFYERRLSAVQKSKLQQDGQSLSSHIGMDNTGRRARDLSPTLQDQYEEYYLQRLTTLKRSMPREKEMNEEEADEKEVNKGEVEDEAPFAGWQNLLIRNKTLLSNDELGEEEALYKQRLNALQAQKEALSRTSTSDAEIPQGSLGYDHAANAVVDISKNAELTAYFTDRLRFIQEAKRRKEQGTKNQAQAAPKLTETHQLETDSELRRFMGTKANEGVESLKKQYRKHGYNLQEARIALMELQGRPKDKDILIIRQLQARVGYFTGRLEVFERLISERYAKMEPGTEHETKLPPMRRPPREEQDSSAPRRFTISTKKIQKREQNKQSLEEASEPKASNTLSPDDAAKQLDARINKARRTLHKLHHASRAVSETPSQGGGGNAESNKGPDPLLIKHFEGEEIPSSEGFMSLGGRKGIDNKDS